MNPYTLHCGDARHILPSIGPVDCVITDPIWPNAPDGMFEESAPQDLLQQALEMIEAKRVVVVLRSDSDPRFLQAVPPKFPFFNAQILPWILPRPNGRKLLGNLIAYGFGEPIPSRPGQRVISGRASPAKPDKQAREISGHPCPRSIEHMRYLVRWWSEPHETVLDPFMGSGTTGAACIELERRFIGIEINRQYYNYAEHRLASLAATPRFQFHPSDSVQHKMEMVL